MAEKKETDEPVTDEEQMAEIKANDVKDLKVNGSNDTTDEGEKKENEKEEENEESSEDEELPPGIAPLFASSP